MLKYHTPQQLISRLWLFSLTNYIIKNKIYISSCILITNIINIQLIKPLTKIILPIEILVSRDLYVIYEEYIHKMYNLS